MCRMSAVALAILVIQQGYAEDISFMAVAKMSHTLFFLIIIKL